MCGIGGGPGGGDGGGEGGQGISGDALSGVVGGMPTGGLGGVPPGVVGGNVASGAMPIGAEQGGTFGLGGATAPPGNSDITAFNIGKTVMGLLAAVTGIATSPAVALPAMGLGMMVNAARGAGQPPGEVGPAMAAGANPGGIGGPGGGMDLSSLTTGMGLNPLLQNEQQKPPSISEPKNLTMPLGNITSSLLSVPPPKVDPRNIMAARGVRGMGAKTALPEWFTQGKRGY